MLIGQFQCEANQWLLSMMAAWTSMSTDATSQAGLPTFTPAVWFFPGAPGRPLKVQDTGLDGPLILSSSRALLMFMLVKAIFRANPKVTITIYTEKHFRATEDWVGWHTYWHWSIPALSSCAYLSGKVHLAAFISLTWSCYHLETKSQQTLIREHKPCDSHIHGANMKLHAVSNGIHQGPISGSNVQNPNIHTLLALWFQCGNLCGLKSWRSSGGIFVLF